MKTLGAGKFAALTKLESVIGNNVVVTNAVLYIVFSILRSIPKKLSHSRHGFVSVINLCSGMNPLDSFQPLDQHSIPIL